MCLLAGVRRQLQRVELSRWDTSLELPRFSPFVYDRLPSPVRRVDRVDLGLYPLLRLPLRSVLPPHNDHRKPSRTWLTVLEPSCYYYCCKFTNKNNDVPATSESCNVFRLNLTNCRPDSYIQRQRCRLRWNLNQSWNLCILCDLCVFVHV